MENTIVNKRGRKPKSHIIPTLKTYNNANTPIIAHLPINYSDIINEQTADIFIKSNLEIDNKCKEQTFYEKEIKLLKNKIYELTEKLEKYEKINKPNVDIIESNNLSKCWWCKYSYNSPTVELPEYYFNNMFYYTGKFCSYNCAMAFNIDMNDENISKRNSLLYFHCKKTYNKNDNIIPSPSWKILKDFGGTVDIEEYRKNFITNTTNYLYIKPPLVSRISYVEKVPTVEIVDVCKTNDYVLKRSKPLNSTKYTLESTIGLKKIINVVKS